MIKKIIDYFKGWVKFDLTGEFKSDFFSRVSSENIPIYHTQKINNKISVKSNIQDYKKISKIAKETKNKVKVRKKYGFIFFKHKHRKRYGICVGAILCIFCLIFSQCFIWEIRFAEYDEKKLEYLKQEMSLYGIEIGAYYPSLDFKEIQQKILMKDNNLSRISFNRKGSVLEVEISTRDQNLSVSQKDPCDIVADKTAQIISIDTYNGQRQVNPLDIVMKGDTLISGKQLLSDGSYKAVHADGKIIAQTYFSHSISLGYQQNEKQYTQQKQRYTINFLNFNIPLFINFDIDSLYDIESIKSQIDIFGLKLPIYITCNTYNLYNLKEVLYTQQQVLDELYKAFDEYEKEQLNGSTIIEKSDDIQKQDDKITITRKYIVQEEIGIKKLLYNNE